ncbi:UDP-N-acetylmuramate dehydrogenase [Candidatus Woesebacteria bacterium]|nr:UDP-N-acetylmuramate dehydrogenase [Candidatus Woesebacteria bacterium]
MKVQENIPLKSLTTFGVGGIATHYTEVGNEEDLRSALNFANRKKLPTFVLGEGSNVLISDHKLKVLVIRLINREIRFENNKVIAGGGVNWDKLVDKCVNRGLQGIECLSGIPGTVGAAPYQNIGAYGQELKDTFLELKAYDLKLNKFVVLTKNDCKFGYRDSVFKDPKYKNCYIIFKVALKLHKNKKPKISYESLKKNLEENNIKDPSLKQVRESVLKIRAQKLVDPKKIGNAGSFFKNPIVETSVLKKIQEKNPDVPSFPADDHKVKLFAGWLIEKAGWKGRKYCGAAVSDKNALVLINKGGKATCDDVTKLAGQIVRDVKAKFDVELSPEVQLISYV